MTDDKGPGSGGKKEKWVDMSELSVGGRGKGCVGKEGASSLGVWERVVLCSKEGLSLWRGRK